MTEEQVLIKIGSKVYEAIPYDEAYQVFDITEESIPVFEGEFETLEEVASYIRSISNE